MKPKAIHKTKEQNLSQDSKKDSLSCISTGNIQKNENEVANTETIIAKKRLYKLSLISLLISAFLFVAAYFFFHYVTDDGITLIKQAEAGKPFVTNLIGYLATQMLFASIFSSLFAKIVLTRTK